MLRRGVCVRVGQAPLGGQRSVLLCCNSWYSRQLQCKLTRSTSVSARAGSPVATSQAALLLRPKCYQVVAAQPPKVRWQPATCRMSCAALWKGAPSSCALGLTQALPPCNPTFKPVLTRQARKGRGLPQSCATHGSGVRPVAAMAQAGGKRKLPEPEGGAASQRVLAARVCCPGLPLRRPQLACRCHAPTRPALAAGGHLPALCRRRV